MKRLLVSSLLIIAGTVCVFAQTTAGRLSGTVSGPDGVLPGATVTILYSVTGRETTTITNESGNFRFPQIDPGTYRVTISASGFKTFVANDLKVDVAREYTFDRTLEIGEIQETVTVTAGTDIVTSTTSQVTNTVSPQQIMALPLITRNPLNLTTLQPGVASNPFQGTSINGLRTTMTNITRDGISINDQFIRANATDFAPGRPSVDDTGEFTLATSNQESDLGSGGAQIILTTPRGSTTLHGALFAYNRNSAFAANTFFNNRTPNNADGTQATIAKKPGFRNRNQYGGKISGTVPVPHFGSGGPMFDSNKLFFFFAYEGIKDPVTTRATRTILTPSARMGTFQFNRATAGNVINSGGISCPSGAVNSICTVTNILSFAQGVGFTGIPSTIGPLVQSRILSVLPNQGNATGLGDDLNTTGFGLNRRADQTRNTYTTRVDVDPTDKDTINFVYSYNKENNLRPDIDSTGFSVVPEGSQFSANKQFTATYRRIFSDSMVNEVRWGIFTSEVPFVRTSARPDFFLGPSGTTSSTLAGIISQPDNVFLDQGRNNKLYNFADNVTKIFGNHALKFGGQFQLYKVNSYNDVLIIPNYIIGTTNVNAATTTTLATTHFPNQGGAGSLISTTQLATANGLLAIMGGLVNSATRGFNTSSPTSGYAPVRNLSPFRNSNHSLYISDKWSVARNLTVTLGMRYELYPAMRIKNGLSLEPVIVDQNNPASGLLAGNGTFNVVGTNAGKEFLYYNTDYNNFAPNVGVAWTPNFESGIGKFMFGSSGRSVIRGGYSHIYGNDSIITSLNGTLNQNVGLGRASSLAIGPTGTTALNDRLSGPLATIAPPVFVSPPRSFLQNNTSAQGFFGVANAVDPNLQIPKVEQYSFGWQREFFGNTAFEVRYVGSRGNNLTRGIDVNQIDVVNNGFLADFLRAQSNLALPGATTPFCNPVTTAGCQALTIFQNGGTSAAGRLAVGTGVTLNQFIADLRNGIVADLAHRFVTTNRNNHPTLAAPGNVPWVKFYENPNIGQIELFTNAGSYNYNSLQLELRRRFTQGLYFQTNYTFSKNLTDTIGTSQGLFEPYLQNQSRELDKQRADFDQTHTFNFNGIYEMPFGKGKPFMNYGGAVDKILGGWTVSGLTQWSTGAPITLVDSRGTLNRGARSGRQTANSSLTNQEIRNLIGVFEANGRIYWINPSIINPSTGTGSNGYISPTNSNTAFPGQVFFNVDPGQTGNVARTLFSGPNYFNVNAAVLKNIKFTESMKIQFRAEAFNVLNNVNFRNNTQFANINSAGFGQITSAAGPREIQFALRFEF